MVCKINNYKLYIYCYYKQLCGYVGIIINNQYVIIVKAYLIVIFSNLKFINNLDNFKKAWHTRVEKESENEEVQLLSKRRRTLLDVSTSSSDDGN